MSFVLESPSFAENGRLPNSAVFNGFGHSGENRSPALQWSGAPANTKSFALTCYDPDAPSTVGFWHWLLFNIPSSTQALSENAGAAGNGPAGSVECYTDFGAPGFGGAAPPPGNPHHYHFTLYALDVEKLEVGPGTTGAFAMIMTLGHVLGKATLTALYGG